MICLQIVGKAAALYLLDVIEKKYLLLHSTGCLAFTLASKKLKMVMEEPAYMNPGSMYQGEVNPGFMPDNLSLTGSRKSGGLQPVMLMPHGPPDER